MNRKAYIRPILTNYGDIPSITQGLAGDGGDSTSRHENCDVLKDGNMNGTTMDGTDPVGCMPVS